MCLHISTAFFGHIREDHIKIQRCVYDDGAPEGQNGSQQRYHRRNVKTFNRSFDGTFLTVGVNRALRQLLWSILKSNHGLFTQLETDSDVCTTVTIMDRE